MLHTKKVVPFPARPRPGVVRVIVVVEHHMPEDLALELRVVRGPRRSLDGAIDVEADVGEAA